MIICVCRSLTSAEILPRFLKEGVVIEYGRWDVPQETGGSVPKVVGTHCPSREDRVSRRVPDREHPMEGVLQFWPREWYEP